MAGQSNNLKLKLKVWKQKGPKDKGHFFEYDANNVTTDMSFLEMLDVVNEELVHAGKEPIEFDHDCREGICGMCSLVINGEPHGPQKSTTTCQLHMRSFKDGDTIAIEPFRAKAFPVVRDLIVDRSSFDRIQASGGYNSVNTGNADDANSILIGKDTADEAFNAATCIGCGACVAVCTNASASLFTSAKLAHLSRIPQGQPEREERTLNMVSQMDAEGFGSCTNTGACHEACPKEIPLEFIAEMNREYLKASIKKK